MIRRILYIAAALLVAAGAVIAVTASAETDDDAYMIRAVFDGASFVVPDEDVRVGGANVGHVETIDVSREGEIVSFEDGGRAIPGKAIIVLAITDPGFKDFREDAGCTIRPQSLIGEKYIDCRPTEPRRPGSEPPPPLPEIPDDQPGDGQYLLPLENNGKLVDIDLVNNIMRRPYAERFRIILNELGGSFAARGEDIDEIVERANPAMREVNKVFGILTRQRRQLAQLTADSDQIMRPLARERQRVVGFMRNSGEAAEASAEYSDQIRESFNKFPIFLREFRQTMGELGGFAEAGTPLARDLNEAAPAFTVATQALTPFSQASTVALKSLGEAGEEAGPLFAEAVPVVTASSRLARTGAQPMYDFSSFLTSTQRTGGFEGLMDLIYNTTGVMNGFDRYGHIARTLLTPTNCLNYETAETTGCGANFRDLSSSGISYEQMIDLLYALAEAPSGSDGDRDSGGIEPGSAAAGGTSAGGAAPGDDGDDDSSAEEEPQAGPGAGDAGDDEDADEDAGPASGSSGQPDNGGGAGADLLDYLLGP